MPVVPFEKQNLWDDGDISEKIASTSPNSTSISIDGDARASITYIVNGINEKLEIETNPLSLFCQQVLGKTEINTVDGSLKRTPPMAHPQFRWLYAERISSIKGIGLERKVEGDITTDLLSVDTSPANSWQYVAPYFVVYDKYEVTIEFSARPYLVVSDQGIDALNDEFPGVYRIEGADGDYAMDDGSPNSCSGNPIKEYKRYTTYATEPSAEFLTMKGGAYKFSSDVSQVNNSTIVGFYGKTLVPKVVFKMTWFQIPYEFVDPTNDASTNIYEALGRVNQHYWYGFEPGELLFTGFTNTPKIKQQFDFNSYALSDIKKIPEMEGLLYADIVLNFLYIPIFSTTTNGDPYPSEPSGIINPDNLSYINAGHNLAQSNVNKKYYPVISEDVDNPVPPNNLKKKPIYDSYPFELIFNALPYKMTTV